MAREDKRNSRKKLNKETEKEKKAKMTQRVLSLLRPPGRPGESQEEELEV